ncbi:cobalt ABC transporter permease [Citreicella sp. C3M06]|uniref:cobalt ABC transporter permease n=1 Tax=Citreicella sp. C3M06 TaxID=2841564 RepID=UPI001C0A6559|nr:cobalt ABC transporter permease [Citreicella sp. C3M06]MBU2962027.1 cobalt ABC transporter permease [Citreicella sp. C3M06]
MKALIVALALIIGPAPALAHKVIAGVFAAGSAIEGEIGFSNGDMAVEAQVLVLGPDGTELGQAITDADGFFTFVPTQPIAHLFRADLGAGHLAEVTMPADEVAAILGLAPIKSAEVTETAPPSSALSNAERQAIAEAVRNEIRPLRREIAAYKEHTGLQTILGGIGYIAGLFGLGFYLAARRKLAA